MAAAILALGVGAFSTPAAGAVVDDAACGFFIAYLRRRRDWSETRLALTNEMVEHLVGQQTRLAQESDAEWHRSEDPALADYHAASRHMDRWQLLLNVVIVRGWLPVSLAALAHTFVLGGASEVTLAVSLGAVLLAQQAIGQLINSGIALADAYIAWGLVGPLFRAASKPSEQPGSVRRANPARPDERRTEN